MRAEATVPDVTFEALIAVNATPFPEMLVVVIALAVNEPLASRATMVDAPFAEAAVVLAFAIVPALILEALIDVRVNPAPMKLAAVALPVAVTLPVAETFPAVE
jgi:hypothetical protein